MFDVYENQISQLKAGQKITVSTNAYPNKEFDATISFIDPRLNIQSRTTTVRATLNNKEGIFKPGMFISSKIQLVVEGDADTLVNIPATAVLWTGKRSLVYVKTSPSEPIFEIREVELGIKNGDVYTILDGLSKGEEVVVNGTFTVDAAAQLQGKRSMMSDEDSSQTVAKIELEDIGRQEVPLKFQEQLKAVFDAYMVIEDALVNDKASTEEEATTLLHSLEEVDMKLLKEEPGHSHWMVLDEGLQEAALAIFKTSDIQEQRNYFF